MADIEGINNLAFCSENCSIDPNCPIRTIFLTRGSKVEQVQKVEKGRNIKVHNEHGPRDDKKSFYVNCTLGLGRMVITSQSER